ncbi:hypothetical protein [Cognatilysobacter terrigena]|uniref:hypothetical protein n=1 Tax=Cognatilysobacter terrigena TaxID=2488749 RepID=UPI00105F02B8|nr:hypothetical protein [Lysobacter terrigena]
MPSALRRFFSDANGRLVIAQRPNLPLVLWAAFAIAARLMPPSHTRDVVGFVGSALAFTWAWLELTDGDSPFRRVLGALVLVGIVVLRAMG